MLTIKNAVGRGIFLAAMLALLAYLNRAPHARGLWLTRLGLLMLFWLDFQTHAPQQNPLVEPAIYAPGFPTLAKLNPKPALGESRFLLSPRAIDKYRDTMLRDPVNDYICNRAGLFDNANLLDSVPKVDGFYSLFIREMAQVESGLYSDTNTMRTNLCDFVGASQVSAATNFLEWEARTNFMPLITAGQRPIYAAGTNSLLVILKPDFDPRRTVCLPDTARGSIQITNETQTRVLSHRFAAHRVEAEVTSEGPGLVVIAAAYYHWWRAYVDGVRVPLWRANHAFQALQVPSGQHRVRLVYFDEYFYAGAAISGLTFLSCLIGWFSYRRR